jgi:hypothetical protein
MPPETAGALLRRGGDRLVQAGIAGGRRDARLLLQYAAGLSQTDLVAEPDRMMAEHDAALFDQFVARRIRVSRYRASPVSASSTGGALT